MVRSSFAGNGGIVLQVHCCRSRQPYDAMRAETSARDRAALDPPPPVAFDQGSSEPAQEPPMKHPHRRRFLAWSAALAASSLLAAGAPHAQAQEPVLIGVT